MPLPQLVPSRVCLQCDVCCRFPERDSYLRPYFTTEEIRRAMARGIDPQHFPDPRGCQISVVPNPSGEGYLCPAFDPQTSHCRIYEDRPLDCQIYPLAVMWAPPAAAGEGREARGEGLEVVLGWDSKCPFARESVPADIRAYAERIAAWLEQDDTVETFAKHPRLIGRFQEDVVVLGPLPKLTARMRGGEKERGTPSLALPTGGGGQGWGGFELRPLTPANHSRFAQAFALVDTELAHFALAPHLIWRHLFTYNWAEIEGCLCLFAEYTDGMYMPLPPLPAGEGMRLEVRGQRTESSPMPLASCPSPAALAACFALMRARNGGRAVSRIENVPEEWGERLGAMGYRVRPKDPDYLYRTADLVALTGDPYRSQRAACNRFEREHRHSCEPYRDEDRDACLALFCDWSAQKQAAGLEDAGRHILGDAEVAHREALTAHRDLGLVGRIVRVDGRVRAYTFGYRRSPSVFCVLLEIADRAIPGLAPFIFREFCREAAAGGSEFINTMDDAGLPSLAHAKRTYHPVRLVPSFIVLEE
jgi:Fe-S-cluster containining protein